MNKSVGKSDKNQEKDTRIFFQRCYVAYKKFMNISNMTSIKIKPFSNENSPACYVQHTKKLDIIYANQALLQAYGEKSTKSIAFHEYTHVYDQYLLKKNNIIFEENNNWIYTEYHATMIEMMCALQFNNINDMPEIDVNSSTIYLGTPKILKEYLVNEKNDMITTLDKLLSKPLSTESWIAPARFVLYTLGRIAFLEKYCRDGLHFFDMEEYLKSKFGNTVKKLQAQLLIMNPLDTNEYNFITKSLCEMMYPLVAQNLD